jgi:hypothetical protein
VDVVEINVIDAHLLQTALKAFTEELGAVIGRDVPLALVADCESDAELGGQEDVGATLGVQLEPLSDQDLVVAVAVGCIPIRIAELPGAVQKRQTLFVITGGVLELWLKVRAHIEQLTRRVRRPYSDPSFQSRGRAPVVPSCREVWWAEMLEVPWWITGGAGRERWAMGDQMSMSSVRRRRPLSWQISWKTGIGLRL